MNLSDFASPAENKAANTKPAWIDAESYWIHIISDPSAQTSVSRPLLGKQGNMSETFDIYTLLFLVLAVVIFLRLRNVLGRRTGSERPPYDPYSARDAQHNGNKSSSRDKVVPLPRAGKANQPSDSGRNLEDFEERIKDVAPAGSPLSENLLAIAKTDPTFDPLQFIKGAKTAYEMIVMAFAEGNKRALKPLLNRDVYDRFSTVISDREAKGEIVDSSFVGIDKTSIIDAELKSRTAQITVKFVSELITAVRNRAGEVIEGDPKKIREVTDIWTFAREITSRDPNWKLIATESAN